MALFESYERRIDKINEVLGQLWHCFHRRSRKDHKGCRT